MKVRNSLNYRKKIELSNSGEPGIYFPMTKIGEQIHVVKLHYVLINSVTYVK